MAKLLELKDLSRKFGGLEAVSGVNMEISRGTIVGLAGPNGAGKTPLFNLVSGFIFPTSGTVYFEGDDITGWSVPRRVSAGITRTFQGSRVFPGLTVKENVLTGTYSARNKRLLERLPTGSGEEGDKEEDLVLDWIIEVTKLTGYEETPACNLSYGYRQRLELAIALATNPRLLLLDEPFSGTHYSDLVELAGLLNLLRDMGLTVIIVEHDIASVVNVADRLVYMEAGKVTIPNG